MVFKQLFVLSFLFLIFFSTALEAQSVRDENPFETVSTFKIYYGSINSSIETTLKEYDMVILEPSFTSKNNINTFMKVGTTPIGYLSVMEIPTWDEEILSMISTKEYIIMNGTPLKTPEYDQYLGDIRSESYQNTLLTIIKQRIIDKGFQGIFLDTIDFIEDLSVITDADLVEEMQNGYIDFLQKIKQEYPNLLIIQNRGLSLFTEKSNPYIDGILWENLQLLSILENNSAFALFQKINSLYSEQHIVPFAVIHKQDFINSTFCRLFNWKYLYHPQGAYYHEWTE